MRLLNLNDTHFSGTNSENRQGDMLSDFLIKLDETIALSKGCDFVVHSGDMFHTHTVANNVVDEIVDRIEASNIPWYVVVGNHDSSCGYYRPQDGTSINHIFRRSKNIKHLESINCDDSYIKGYDYYHNIENEFKVNGIVTDSKKPIKIAVTHALITTKPYMPNVLHIQINEIKTNYDIVLCSHLHEGTGITEHQGTKYVNVGAWGRRSISEAKHSPQVTIIDTKGKKQIEIIKLKSAKPGKKVFDLTKKAEEKATKVSLDSFVDAIKNTKAQSLDIRGNVEYFSKQGNIDREITDLIINKIGEVEANG